MPKFQPLKIPNAYAFTILKIFLIFIGVILGVGIFIKTYHPLNHPFYIDELVYSGQYFYGIVTHPFQFFWTVDAKQPLLFWIYLLVYRLFPSSLNQKPLFILYMVRILSIAFICSVPLLLILFHPPQRKKWLHWLSACVIFLFSPFVLVHSQLAIVEPLLIFTATLVLLCSYRFLKNPSLQGLLLTVFSNFLLAMTKTNGLIIFAGMAGGCFFFYFLDRPHKRSYAILFFLHMISLIGGYYFVLKNPILKHESRHILDFSTFNISDLPAILEHYHTLLFYYFPYFLPVLLCYGGWLLYKDHKKEDPRLFALLLSLFFISLISFFITLIGIKFREAPTRYYVFTFFPWMIAGWLFFSRILDQLETKESHVKYFRFFLISFVSIVLIDLVTVCPIFLDSKGLSHRIHPIDRYHYYGQFTVESLKGIETALLEENTEVYGLSPPYTEGMIARLLLGVNEAQKRVKDLPSIETINHIQCNNSFKNTYFLVGNWLNQKNIKNQQTDYDIVRTYHTLQSDNSTSLIRKRCDHLN